MNKNLVGWILDFLTSWNQRVRVHGTLSSRGCVLSPSLCILCTNVSEQVWKNRDILKSADESSGSRDQPRPTQRWFWQKMWSCTHAQATTSIKGSIVECVWCYKYLGTIIDSKLNFKSSFEAACKNGDQRLSCLRKRSRFHANKTTMVLFQHASARSVLSFPLGVVVWIFICRKQKLSQSNC